MLNTTEKQALCYVDRVMKGAKVGDLPVERPSKFTLIVNLKTAKAWGSRGRSRWSSARTR